VGFSFSFDYDKGTREYYAFVRYPSGKAKEVWYDRKGYTRRVDINGVTIESVEVSGRRQWVTNARGLITEQERDEWDNIVSAQQTPSFFIPPPMLCCAELFQGGAYGAEQAIRQRCKTQLLG
jgi:hypothetical protein